MKVLNLEKQFLSKFIFILLNFITIGKINSEIYTPPGYGSGSNLQGTGFGIDFGYSKIEEDAYVNITPSFELPFFALRIGLRIPLEILVYDEEPKQTTKTPALRPGTYETTDDYVKIINYVAYGTHLYFDPDDSFNWSMFYGQMTDGYIGHRTIVDRYVSSYDPTVWSPGLMFDINNNWGGVEYFTNNALRKEVRGYRVYIRPVGIFNSMYNISYDDSGFDPNSVVYSIKENRDPGINREFLFQTVPEESPNEKRMIQQGKGGSLRQHLLRPLKEYLKESQIELKEAVDPATGEVKLIPCEKENVPGMTPSDKQNINLQNEQKEKQMEDSDKGLDDSKKTKRSHGFWNRWAIGFTKVIDYDAPLTLEYDGSSNLVVDPETKLPRPYQTENLTITGYDMEIRLSPFRWMDITPYIDINTIKNLKKSKGTHIGVNIEMKLSNLFKWYFRPEYREITSNYIPAYFDSLYAIQRINYQSDLNDSSNIATTKLSYLKSLPSDRAISKGYYINSILEFINFFVIELSYEDYPGPYNSKVFVGFYVPNMILGIFLNGYYIKSNFDKFSEAFQIKSENAMLAAEAGITLYGGLYFKYTIKRTWTYNNETGEYVPVDEKIIGFGFSSSN